MNNDCADDMNEWLADKTVQLKVFNHEIDFEIEQKPVREDEFWMTAISLKPDQFTDVGFRFRRN